MDLRVEDFFIEYPSQDDPLFQQKIGAKKEFQDLRGSPDEPAPTIRGQLFRHQKMIQRYMTWFDDLLIMDEPGTGKSCTVFAVMEWWKKRRGHIKHVYVLAKGKQTKRELINQLVCKCTAGQYETEHLKKAETQEAQTKRINAILKDWYTITTVRSFLNKVRARFWSEDGPDIDGLRETYSDSIFWFDEVHTIRPDQHLDPDRSQQQKIIHYDTLKTLFHSIVRSKRILTSATPMINDERELIYHLNLLNPKDRQLPEDYDLVGASLDDLKPYVYGKVHYLRAIHNIVVPRYAGVVIPTAPGAPYQYQFMVYPTEMSDFQYRTYKYHNDREQRERKQGSAVRPVGRQASNFVYPPYPDFNPFTDTESIGLVGNEGFNKYVQKRGPDDYIPTDEFIPWISNLGNIKQCSCKFYDILIRIRDRDRQEEIDPRKLNDPSYVRGIMFVYGYFLEGSGLITFTLCLQYALNYNKFNETVTIFKTSFENRSFCQSVNDRKEERPTRKPPDKRFAILTLEVSASESKSNTIMETLNSFENRHGDYISVFVSSPVGRDGININNCTNIEIIDSDWNRSGTYQAESRGIRVASQLDLYMERENLYTRLGIKTPVPPIEVTVRRHAAVADEDDDFVNLTMYATSEDKDRRIKKVERKLKQLSFSCWLDYNRNVRTDYPDGSAYCDYDICEYQCYNPPPGPEVDTSTFDILYVDELLDDLIPEISSYFKTNFVSTINNVYKNFPKINTRYIDLAIDKIIREKISIVNRFGIISYLCESNGNLYLNREYPFRTDPRNYQTSYYTENLTMISSMPSIEIAHELSKTEQARLSQLLEESKTDIERATLLDRLDVSSKVDLLETAILNLAMYLENNKSSINWSSVDQTFPGDRGIDLYIRRKYSKYWYIVKRPSELIAGITSKKLKKGPGRPPKPKTEEELQRQFRLGITDKIKRAELMEIRENIDPSEPNIYIHNLYALELKTELNYNAVTSFMRGDGRIRILEKPYIKWRLVDQVEQVAYNQIIQKRIDAMIIPYEKFDHYGTYIGGVFRIVNMAEERAKKEYKDPSSKSGAHEAARGLDCVSTSIQTLLDILWDTGAPDPEPKDLTETEKRSNPKFSDQVNHRGFDSKKLDFYYNYWAINDRAPKKGLCPIVMKHLENIGRFIYVD